VPRSRDAQHLVAVATHHHARLGAVGIGGDQELARETF
jgi:hypothetical protein